MARISRYSVAKTQRSYDPDGVNAVQGSKMFSALLSNGELKLLLMPFPPILRLLLLRGCCQLLIITGTFGSLFFNFIMTELEAINRMLAAIGQAPITSIDVR